MSYVVEIFGYWELMPLVATSNGRIEFSSSKTWYSGLVFVKNCLGNISLYAYCSELYMVIKKSREIEKRP